MDAVTARGHQALHIISEARADPHRLTSFAVLDGPLVLYPKHRQAPLF